MTDFDPTAEETISYPRKTQNSQRETFYPTDGSSVAIIYLEAPVGKKVAIKNALAAIAAACAEYKQFKAWTVSSEAGKRAAVHVRAQVHNDIGIGE